MNQIRDQYITDLLTRQITQEREGFELLARVGPTRFDGKPDLTLALREGILYKIDRRGDEGEVQVSLLGDLYMEVSHLCSHAVTQREDAIEVELGERLREFAEQDHEVASCVETLRDVAELAVDRPL